MADRRQTDATKRVAHDQASDRPGGGLHDRPSGLPVQRAALVDGQADDGGELGAGVRAADGGAVSVGGGPSAQLHVQRGGVVTWYRRLAGELWTARADARGELASVVAAGLWLGSDGGGAPRLAASPSSSAWAALEHPRTGRWLLADEGGLREHDGAVVLPNAIITALVCSADLRRAYAAGLDGRVWAVPMAPAGGGIVLEGESGPSRLLDLAGVAGGVSLALDPAGLIAATATEVIGINLRLGTARRLFEWRRGDVGVDEVPAIAVDAARNIYLADAGEVWRYRGEGGAPRLVARASGPR